MIATDALTPNPDGFAFYCRTDEHDRCSMVCACPHHDELRPLSSAARWARVPAAERLRLIDGGD
jgi:hypothetical protein